MKKFSFRLEPVLKKRLENEEDAAMAQALAQMEYQKQLSVLQGIRSSLDSTLDNMDKDLSVGEWRTGALYLDFLKKSESRQEKVTEDRQIVLEKKRDDMVEARKDRMILQKLKERLHEKYNDRLEQFEAKLLDDQCTILAHRNRCN